MIRWLAIPEGETEDYGPGYWTNGENQAAKALWNEHKRHRFWQRLQQEKSAGAIARMIFLNDVGISLNVFKSYA
jgi:hypothetical protein